MDADQHRKDGKDVARIKSAPGLLQGYHPIISGAALNHLQADQPAKILELSTKPCPFYQFISLVSLISQAS